MTRTGILIDNQWRDAGSGRTIAVLAPATGKEFTRIPCMNEHPLWIAALENMANAFLQKP